MKSSYLIFFALLVPYTSQDRPRKIRYKLSSKGPNVTIHLNWDPPFCEDRSVRRQWIKLCSKQNKCHEKQVLIEDTASFDSSDDMPLSFFSSYQVMIAYRCPSRTKWSSRRIDTDAGELRSLRGVKATGGNRSGIITWLTPTEIGDDVEITVCQKSTAKCLPPLRTSILSGNYTVEQLLPGVEYTAMLSVYKEFKNQTYRSKAVSVDLKTSDIEDRPRKIRYKLSSKGPNVTIHLHWDPPFCEDRSVKRHWVKLCSKQNKCSEKLVLIGNSESFDSSENKPLSFFSSYQVMIAYRCPSRTKWSSRRIDTDAGELRRLRGVKATGRNQNGVITWLASTEIGDYVEIRVCQKSPAKCLPPIRTSILSGNYTVERLSPGVEYTATLSVCKEFKGNTYRSKAVSAEFKTSTIEVPGPPLGVRVTLLRGHKIVLWNETDRRFNVEAYKIVATAISSREQTIAFRKSPRFEACVLQPYTRYILSISACVDAAGNECGPPTTLDVLSADRGYPSKPRVELVGRNATVVIIRWSEPEEPAGPIDGYEFAYGRSGDAFTASNWVRVGSLERSATVKDLEVDTTYEFHVVAFNLDYNGRPLYSLAGILEVKMKG